MRRLAAIALALVVFGSAGRAQDEAEPARDLDARTRAVAETLRCVVCKNQSIADSDADLAKSMVATVRERLEAGDSEEEVRAFFVHRYGEFVLLKPLASWRNGLLWAGPGLVLLAGLGGAAVFIGGRRKAPSEPAPLSDAERAALDEIVGPDG